MPQNKRSNVKEKSLFISCIVPIHNEEENIQEFLPKLIETISSHSPRFEIILIDDGSQDNTLSIIEKEFTQEYIKLIAFSRNFGKENALTAGLEYCQGDVAILIDADSQHPLETIDQFVSKWRGGYDMVYGVRRHRKDETIAKRWFAKLFYRLMDSLSEVKIPPDAGDFRLLDRKVIDALNSCGEYSRFMKGLYAWVGFKSYAITYEAQDRFAGKTSWSFFKLFDLALTGIISFSDIPIRVWGIIGIIISSLSLAYALWIIISTLVFGVDTPGFATLATAIMFFGGIQLMSIGILGEYIGRIFREVKKRPHYIIAKTRGFPK